MYRVALRSWQLHTEVPGMHFFCCVDWLERQCVSFGCHGCPLSIYGSYGCSCAH